MAGDDPIASKDGGAPEHERPYVDRTKITVFDLTGTPTITSERWLEGNYVAARRHGDAVRVLVSSYRWFDASNPVDAALPYGTDITFDRVTAWRDAALELVDRSTLDDYLPIMEERVGPSIVRVPSDCSSYLLPPPGVANTGMLRVATVSAADPSVFESTTIVGRADTTYANAESLVVAQNDYRFGRFGGLARQEVALHVFSLDGFETRYTASGKVAGAVSGQFAMDMQDDVLRLALTEDRLESTVAPEPFIGFVATRPVTSVVTLKVDGNALEAIGRSPDLAPGERMQSVRFLGDRAYVVTFLRVDPLFVIDMSNPRDLRVLAELEIPGFSEYVHPLEDGYLLTIGRDVDPNSNLDLGLALSIFDVTDDTDPVLAHRVTIPGSSGAEWNHHDFIFDRGHGILAIPVYEYSTTFITELVLFSVSVEGGIAELGRIDHRRFFDDCEVPSDEPWGGYSCWYTPSVRRGLFIDDFVYSISSGGVLVHELTDLATAVASVPLPAPVQWYPYYRF